MSPKNGFDKFQGSTDYIASPDLRNAVNVAVALERPLLVRGEPGTGKTLLAYSIAKGLNKRLLTWNIKSTTKAQEGLYVYDTVQRLNDSRFGTGDVSDIKRYIKLGKLGESFVADEQVVLLIDEVDKADMEFPNDLLNELDVMSFYIVETMETIKAKQRPIVIITSNAEKELPDAFLRRCVFHYIEFPTPDIMEDIIKVHHPNLKADLLKESLSTFYALREVDQFRKKPSTSELIDWIKVILASDTPPSQLKDKIPYMGALLKKETDLSFFLRTFRDRNALLRSTLNGRS
jgi:MoxR-like ATPase